MTMSSVNYSRIESKIETKKSFIFSKIMRDRQDNYKKFWSNKKMNFIINLIFFFNSWIFKGKDRLFSDPNMGLFSRISRKEKRLSSTISDSSISSNITSSVFSNSSSISSSSAKFKKSSIKSWNFINPSSF